MLFLKSKNNKMFSKEHYGCAKTNCTCSAFDENSFLCYHLEVKEKIVDFFHPY